MVTIYAHRLKLNLNVFLLMFDGVHQMEPFGTHKILFCSCSTAAATWVQMQAKLPPAGITAEKEKR
jgi:hypothetical protein